MKIIPILLISGIFLQSFAHCNAPPKNNTNDRIVQNAIEVRSISPEDTDFSDLAGLKKAIGDAHIVLLGEQTHGGGTTYSAKVRLVKFLHQEMNFEVMAFESGMYDCAKIYKQIQLGGFMEKEVQNSMFYMYANSTEVKPLFSYMDAQKNMKTPLLFTGMDSQHTGEKSQTSLVIDLKNYLDKNGSKNTEGKSWELFNRKVTDIIAMNRQVTEEDKASFYQFLDVLKAEIKEMNSEDQYFPENSGFWLQILKSIESQAKRYWGTIEDMDRDRQMADNMSWLINNPFKGKKVIVWAHNFHIARGMDPILPMGYFLKKEYKDKMYAIGFTGYDGAFINFVTAKESEITKPSKKSIEQAIKNIGWKYAMLDFRNLSEDEAWLQQPQKGRLVNFNEQTAIFPNIFDGIFYIETTIPTVQE